MKLYKKLQLFCLGILLVYVIVIIGAYVFHVKLLVVASDSMVPVLKVGDVLLAKSQEHYRIDDIITFQITGDETAIATHRIVAVTSMVDETTKQSKFLFRTKGDANSHTDLSLISQEQVVGKVVFILPYVGFIILYMQSKYMGFLLIGGIVFMIFLGVKKQIWIMRIKRNET